MGQNFRRARLYRIAMTFAFLVAALVVAVGVSRMNAQGRRGGGAATSDAAATSTTSSFKPTNSPGDPKRGRELFVKDACYQCHGYEGQVANAGMRLGPNPMPPEAIAAFIRKDNGMMPPFSATMVTDQDIVDIVAFLRSVAPPTDIKNIPDFKK